MGRSRKGHFQRETVMKVASSKEATDNVKEVTAKSSMYKGATSTRKVSKLKSGTIAKSKLAKVSTVYSDRK